MKVQNLLLPSRRPRIPSNWIQEACLHLKVEAKLCRWEPINACGLALRSRWPDEERPIWHTVVWNYSFVLSVGFYLAFNSHAKAVQGFTVAS